LVPTGKYRLHLDIEVTGGKRSKHVRSNAVDIRVDK
jgi:hypothetical protein